HHTAIVVFYHVCARTNVVLFLTDDHGACILSVCPSVAKNQPSKAGRTSKKTSDLATDGHGYTRMRSVGFLAVDREKIGTQLYGYVLAKRYTRMTSWCCCDSDSCPADAGTNPRPTAAGGAKEEIYRGPGPSGRGTLLVSR